ncbi:MAG: preprotein translocase subunit SecA, partial [Patescibacteria group bacterium]
VQEKNAKGQPVLVGTTSIEKSEAMSALLTEMKVPHSVLNAKHHEREAEIVAQAGQKGVVTIATNMAGRGTDIKLGPGVTNLGGLAILGTERHEARRIDNQLRGRSGRQGDPGESQFFVSMEDDLMRLFGGDRLKGMMEKLNVPDDVPLENAIVSRAIENAQKKVEGHNFDIRKHVVQYDDVMNKHREIIYKRRQRLLEKISSMGSGLGSGAGEAKDDLHAEILKFIEDEVAVVASLHAADIDPEQWDTSMLSQWIAALHPELGKNFSKETIAKFRSAEELQKALTEACARFYEAKCKTVEPEAVRQAERVVTLRSIDTHWMDHIDTMAHLREQVAFSGYAQRDPLIEYKDQGFRRMQQLLATIQTTIVHTLFQIDVRQFSPAALLAQAAAE